MTIFISTVTQIDHIQVSFLILHNQPGPSGKDNKHHHKDSNPDSTEKTMMVIPIRIEHKTMVTKKRYRDRRFMDLLEDIKKIADVNVERFELY